MRRQYLSHHHPFFHRLKGAYAGQMSGACLAELDEPPTTSPTSEGGADFFYPDYETAWSEATCKNELPLPFGPGGRPIYDTMLACCKGACELH